MKVLASSIMAALVTLAGLAETASARPYDPQGYGLRAPAADRRVEVEWGGSWYASTILDAQRGLYLIHYEGWSSAFDEWVPESRLRFADGVVGCEGEPTTVQIAWGGSWYAGRVMKVAGGQYLVHYDGWSSTFDEWVGPDRLAFTAPARVAPVVAVRPAAYPAYGFDYGAYGGHYAGWGRGGHGRRHGR